MEDQYLQLSIEEWRALQEIDPGTKYEYIDGYVHRIEGNDSVHDRICSNALKVLRDALSDPYKVYNWDKAVHLSPTRYIYSDVTVACDKEDRDESTIVYDEDWEEVGVFDPPVLEAPRVIIEVVSDATDKLDWDDKRFWCYDCPTIQEYALIYTNYQMVEIYRRAFIPTKVKQYRSWRRFQIYSDPSDEIAFYSLMIKIPFAAFYEGTDVRVLRDDPDDGGDRLI